jgi:hypothetical protein
MFLFKTKSNDEPKPTDKRHISARVNINTALKIIKPKERNFLLEHIDDIEN